MNGKVHKRVKVSKPVRVPVRRAARPARVAQEARHSVQPALKVGPANDPLEHEAERTAERVATMAAPAPVAAGTPPPGDAGGGADAAAMRAGTDDQPNLDELESEPEIPSDHQDPEIGAQEDVDTAGVDKGEFDELESGDPEPPPGDAIAPDRGAGAGAVVGAEGGAAPADVAARVAQPGAGRALPDSVRAYMEPRFGTGFADVRVHDRPEDRHAAARIGARAFTHGRHIWLGEGETTENRRLMAHELTHVVQQTRRPAPAQETPKSGAVPAMRTDETVQRGYIRDKAEKYARKVPGYFLLTVILGKSPITGNKVERNAINLIGGFLGLIPGGDTIFQKLQESRALERAYEWVTGRLAELNITWTRIKGLISDFIDEMPSWSPVKVAKRIFGPLVRDIITFVKDIVVKILEFIIRGALALAGPFGEKVWAVIEKARDTIGLILKDPLGFAKNLVKAVVGGFKQFGANIVEHLKRGLLGWLFGGLQKAGIEMPQKLDFKGLISIGLQILGLTYANFRAMLVKALGANGEKKVAFVEKSVEVVKILVKEGFVGVWQRFLAMIDNFKETVIGGIKTFMIETLVMGALSWVAGLSNPVGAIVKVALAIYNMIKAFLERLDQIIEVADAIFSSIGAIARGQTKQAADFIEKTLAATIPVVLAFIAAVIPISGITRSIKNIIKKLQTPVKNAMKKMVTFLVKKTKKLFAKLLGKVNKKRKLPGYKFKVGKKEHSLYAKPKGNKFQLMVASKDEEVGKAQADVKGEIAKAKEMGDDSKQLEMFAQTFGPEVDQAEKETEKVKVNETKTSQKKPAEKSGKEMQDAIKKLLEHGPPLQFNLFIETEAKEGGVIRAREPRIPEVEGLVGTHTERMTVTKQKIDEFLGKYQYGKRGQEAISTFYENDHMPEKSLGKLVKTYVAGDLAKEASGGGAVKRAGKKAAAPAAKGPILGTIDGLEISEKGGALPAMTVYRPTHRGKTAKDAGDRDHGGLIAEAKKGKKLEEKVAILRAGIRKQLDTEVAETKKLYDKDAGATPDIRKNVNAGFSRLDEMNAAIFGITKSAKPVKLEEKPGGEPTDLPMTGGEGIPNFLELEGQMVAHSAKPSGVGNYLEYDHVIDGNLAEKARDLTLGDPAIKEKVAAKVEGKLPADADEATRKSVAGRLGALGRTSVFAGSPAASYSYGGAGTVALYRPIHRKITGPLNADAARGILTGALDDPAGKIADYVATGDDAKKDEGIAAIKAGVRARFDEALKAHIGAIVAEYDTEKAEVATLNAGADASQPMAMITARVKSSLKSLNEASVGLLK